MMRNEIDVHGKLLQEKIDILKNRFNEFYLTVHKRRQQEIVKYQGRLSVGPGTISTVTAQAKQLKLLSSGVRLVEEDEGNHENDIDYEEGGIDMDLRELENCSDVE